MKKYFSLIIILLFTFIADFAYGQTSWTGSTSQDWSDPQNWTNGVPDNSLDAIIGDVNFTGENQPVLSSNSVCKSLSIGGATASILTNNTFNLLVSENFSNYSNGTLNLIAANLIVYGDWLNNGVLNDDSDSDIIFAGESQTVGGTSSVFKNVTVNDRSIIILTSNIIVSGLLNIAGYISDNGSFTASADSVELSGINSQTISSGAFTNKQIKNLIISNTSSSGVTLSDSLGITNSLSFGDVNNAVLNTNGLLIIKSTALNTGRIADATNGGANSGNVVNGDVTVERYIPSNNIRGYRFLASSVNSTSSIHTNWQEGASSKTENPTPGYGTHITGIRIDSFPDQTNGFDGTQTGRPSLFTYDVNSDTYIPVPNTDVLKLDYTTGYLLYVRGDRSINLDIDQQDSTNTILRATGSIAQGTQIYNNLVDTTYPNGGLNVIANPFAAPISWSKILAGNTGITNFFTYFDPKINGGSYVTVDENGSSNPSSSATGDIQSGESFFVQANSNTSPSLIINETYKSSNNNIEVFKAKKALKILYTSLFISDRDGRRNADALSIRFHDEFSKGKDEGDALKVENFKENIAINMAGHHFSVEGRPLPGTFRDIIHLYLSNLSIKQYDLEFRPLNFNENSVKGYLVDNFTGKYSPISFDSLTIVPFNVTSNVASRDSNRFYIELYSTQLMPVLLKTFKGDQKFNGVTLEWKTLQENNLNNYEVEHSTTGINFDKIGTVMAMGNSSNDLLYNYYHKQPAKGINYYRLKINDKRGSFSYSDVINVNIILIQPSVTVYPNPIKGNIVNFHLNNLDKGNYNLSLTDKAGRTVYKSIMEHAGGSHNYSINLGVKLAKGTYQLNLSNYNVQIILQ